MIYFIFFTISSLVKSKKSIKTNNKNKFYFIFPFIWFFVSLFSLLWVVDFSLAIKDFFFIFIFIISFFIINKKEFTTKEIKTSYKVLIFSSILHIFISFYEKGNNTLLFVRDPNDFNRFLYSGSVVSIFTNPNNLSFYFFFIGTLSLLMLIVSKNNIMRIIYFLFLISSFYIIYINFSRATILGIILMISIITLLLTFSKKRYLLFLLFSILGLITIFVFTNNYLSISQNQSEIERLSLIKYSLDIVKRTYLFGTGVGNLELYLADYYGFSAAAHNLWLEVLATFGILFFVVFLFLFLKLLSDNFKIFIKTKNIYSLFYVSIIISFIVLVVGPSSIKHQEWFWIFFALMIRHTIYLNSKYLKEDNVLNIKKT